MLNHQLKNEQKNMIQMIDYFGLMKKDFAGLQIRNEKELEREAFRIY